MSLKKGSPWKYVRKKCVRPVLWVVLYFCFRHDTDSPDFVPLPTIAEFVMAAIICSDIYDVIDQYFLKIDSGKMHTFSEWKQLRNTRK